MPYHCKSINLVFILMLASFLISAYTQPSTNPPPIEIAFASALSLTPATQLSSASSPSTKSTLSTPSSSSNSTSKAAITNPAPQSDVVSPNPSTLSNVLRTGPLTTNLSSTANLNSGYQNYTAATTAFTAFSQLGAGCISQTSISYVAFRQHSTQYYLTPNTFFLSLLQNSSPRPQQLFTAIQNIDCTWSFRSYDGLFVSLNTAFTYLTLSSVLSAGQRFYLQRKQDWIYVQSALSYRYFWVANNGIVMVNMNSASRFVMEVWPNLNAGWN